MPDGFAYVRWFGWEVVWSCSPGSERLAALAEAARLCDPADFAWSFHILTKGAMVASIEGDQRAALRARKLARALIDLHRPDTPGRPQSEQEENDEVEVLRQHSAR